MCKICLFILAEVRVAGGETIALIRVLKLGPKIKIYKLAQLF
jgi:hypothetical protein